MIKKILSCLLALTLCLVCLAGCAKEDDGIPEGMYSVTKEGEPFILYVQGDWTDNRDSGMSSAYYSINNGVTVSARYYALPEGSTLDSYIDGCAESYAERYSGLKIIDRTPSALGGNEAVRYEYTFDRDGVNATVIQYYTLHNGDVIILSFYCATEKYGEEYSAMFEQIRSEFVLTERTEVGGEVVDKKTPEGMKIASPDGIEYVFYVPKTWVTDTTDKLSDAYFPESERSNVTATAFAPDGSMTVEQYFDACQEIYKRDIAGYELISEEPRAIDGKEATAFTYKAVYGEVTYRIMQTVVYYNDMFYSVTYTAIDEVFDSHLDDVETMLGSFDFR